MISGVQSRLAGLKGLFSSEEMILLDIQSKGRISHHISNLNRRIRGEAVTGSDEDMTENTSPSVAGVLQHVSEMHSLLDELDEVQVLLQTGDVELIANSDAKKTTDSDHTRKKQHARKLMGFIGSLVDKAKSLGKKIVKTVGKTGIFNKMKNAGKSLLGSVAPDQNPCIRKSGQGPLVTRDSLSNGGAQTKYPSVCDSSYSCA